MEAEDYRFGNLVTMSDKDWDDVRIDASECEHFEAADFFSDNPKYATITAITHDEAELIAYGCDIDYYNYSEILPIPLTEEWLIKLGFAKTKLTRPYSYQLGRENKPTHKLFRLQFAITINTKTLEESEGYNAIYINNKHWGRCDYIHELQNLIFALSGEELKITNP